MNKTVVLLLMLAALVVTGCRSRTYVLATIDVGAEVSAQIAELEFTSSIMAGGEVVASDQQRFSDGESVSFPSSYVILADDHKTGEVVDIFVEAYDASGATVARGQASAALVAGDETSIRIVLRPGCSTQDDCLGGQAFCDSPHVCTCPGGNCARGFCEPLDLDDGNSCTETICNEAEREATHEVLPNGTACIDGQGEALQCSQGICKAPLCGDFIIDPGEECDDGMLGNSDTEPNACRENCQLPTCGDGVVDNGVALGEVFSEQCDDGADNVIIENGEMVISAGGEVDNNCRQTVTLANGTGETLHCVLPFCGDGRLNGTERCDDHNQSDGDGAFDGCNPTCTLFGEVTTVAGSPGGPGHADGAGDQARVGDVLDFAVGGGFAYFTADGLASGHDHTIRRVALGTGNVTTLTGQDSGFSDGSGSDARFNRPAGLTLAGGSLYIADTGNHSIRRLDLATNEVETVAGTGTPGNSDGVFETAQFNLPTFIVTRSPDELLVFDSATCRVRALDLAAQQITTVAGQSCLPFGNNLFDVGGMATGPGATVYVSDGFAIRQINLADGTITTVAGSVSSPGSADADGDPLSARFGQPAQLVFDGTDLFIADLGNDSIRAFRPSTGKVTTITPNPATDAPRAIGLDGQTLLLGDRTNQVIWKGMFDGSTSIDLVSLAGIVSPAAGESLPAPLGLSMAPGFPDSLYVVDQRAGDHTVDHVSLADGNVSVLFNPTPEVANLLLDVTAVDDRLLVAANGGGVIDLALSAADTIDSSTRAEVDDTVPRSTGLAILNGHVYVTDIANQRLFRSPLSDIGAGELVTGRAGDSAVVDGNLDSARFLAPSGAVACAGKLYISETEVGVRRSHVVREIDIEAGLVITVAGFPTSAGYRDAVDASDVSQFNNPIALACDDRIPLRPILYVADEGNHVIRQIDLAIGRVTTLAGLPGKAASLDGRGSAAAFSSPRGIYFDPISGDLFVSGFAEGVIRRIE